MIEDGYRLEDLAEALGGHLHGDPEQVIGGVNRIEEARPGEIGVAFHAKASRRIQGFRGSALVLPLEGEAPPGNVIRVRDPKRSFIYLLHLFCVEPPPVAGVHPSAMVSPNANLGEQVSVGAGAIVADEVVAGPRVRIHPGAVIGERCEIGQDTEVLPNVTLYPGTRIGERVRIHAGTVIGSDGFGYVPDDDGNQVKIPQVGRVIIEDDVEIGANCTIDRATLGTTRIRAGTKIDNLVQIGHNSTIGRHCVLVAQVGISGSVEIGDHCVLAGQAGVNDHVKLADRVTVGAQSGVIRDLGPGTWLGYPAIPISRALRAYHLVTRLPDLYKEIQGLRKRVAELEGHPRKTPGRDPL